MTSELPRDEVLELYRTAFSSEALLGLRRAFFMDLATTTVPDFCKERIAIIEQVLKERRIKLDDLTRPVES